MENKQEEEKKHLRINYYKEYHKDKVKIPEVLRKNAEVRSKTWHIKVPVAQSTNDPMSSASLLIISQ